jgi:hypothetical protein
MKINIIAILILFCFDNVIYGQPDKLTMDCRDNFRNEDALIFSQAPLGATRITKHHLQVNWTGGSIDFIDEPPYDEPLDGISYYYCGYNSTIDMHLIHKQISGVFTGVLMDNATGKVMPAGEYISFSIDKKKYFSTVQPDGLDGQEWYVYSRNGNLIWRGLSGISEIHPKYKYEYFVAELHNPSWNTAGELEATCVCSTGNEKETIVTLKLVRKNWAWLPNVSCQRANAF